MDIDKQDIWQHYNQLTDDQIERIAFFETADLREEAVEILFQELKRRRFPQELIKAISIPRKGFLREDMRPLNNLIRNRPCPICNQQEGNINAFEIATAKSFLLGTSFNKYLLVACPDCIVSEAKSSNIMSGLLGWWGFPSGPIDTIRALMINSQAQKARQYTGPSEHFLQFVKRNAVIIKVNENNDFFLNGLIAQRTEDI
jgi:hypothetical protein